MKETWIWSNIQGKNHIDVYKDKNKIFVLTSSFESNQIIWLAKLKYTSFNPNGIEEIDNQFYNSGDFTSLSSTNNMK